MMDAERDVYVTIWLRGGEGKGPTWAMSTAELTRLREEWLACVEQGEPRVGVYAGKTANSGIERPVMLRLDEVLAVA